MVKLLWRLREQALAVKARARFIRAGKRHTGVSYLLGMYVLKGALPKRGLHRQQPSCVMCKFEQVVRACVCACVSGRRRGLVLPGTAGLGI